MADAIDLLIQALDAIDGDPDREPDADREPDDTGIADFEALAIAEGRTNPTWFVDCKPPADAE